MRNTLAHASERADAVQAARAEDQEVGQRETVEAGQRMDAPDPTQ